MLKVPVNVAYGALSLFISLLNNVFILFYVTAFTTVFKIDSTWFFIGETVFLLWNSINDPLFGWLTDANLLFGPSQTHNDVVLMRIRALARFGPLFALSFLLFWFNLFPVGLQFTLALCLYDGFLTMVDLNHQALLADLSVKSSDRVELNSFCSMFSAGGSASVWVAFRLWDVNNMVSFQLFCVSLSLAVCVGFYVCCHSLEHFFSSKVKDTVKNKPPSIISQSSLVAARTYVQQTFKHKNFLVFAVMNLVQVFHCHFNSNFFPIFIQHLLGHVITPNGGAALLALSFLVPHINNLYFLQLCKRVGSYTVIKWLFLVKLGLAVLAYYAGTSSWYFLCVFIVSNRVFTEGTCKLLNLVISNLVDEDFVKFRRKSPVSALVFGTSALLSKPGQTLAPLLGSYLLYLNTGRSLFLSEGETAARITHSVDDENNGFREGCFSLLVFVPIATALLQLLAWQFYTLKGSYLRRVKLEREFLEQNHHSLHNI